jgi:hypothetical protein
MRKTSYETASYEEVWARCPRLKSADQNECPSPQVKSATEAHSNRANLDDDDDIDDEDELEEDDFEEEDGSDAPVSQDELSLLIDKGLLRVPDAEQVGESSSEYYHYTSAGVDKVTFKLAAGAGEPLLPLTNVASGGECARVMLGECVCFKSFLTIFWLPLTRE